jgi:hypothetical protein
MSKINSRVNAVYDSLFDKSTKRTKDSLAIIKKVCDEQVNKKHLNFTIAEIARLSKTKGGPSEQTIRNKTSAGETYRSLIDAFSIEYSPTKSITTSSNTKNVTTTIHEIENHHTRIQMYDLLAENLKLKSQIREYELASSAPTIYNLNDNDLSSTLQIEQLNSLEIKALSQFISDDNLLHLGLEIDDNGRLVKLINGDVYTKPGFIDAIRKITTIQGNSLKIGDE